MGSSGRIDTQGTVAELRERGILDAIALDSEINLDIAGAVVNPQQLSDVAMKDGAQEGDIISKIATVGPNKKAPVKLVQEEHRAEGNIKMSIYVTYLRAACVWRHTFIYYAG